MWYSKRFFEKCTYRTGCSGETVITEVESSIVGFPWIGELDTFSLDFLLQFGKALGSTTGYGSVSTTVITSTLPSIINFVHYFNIIFFWFLQGI